MDIRAPPTSLATWLIFCPMRSRILPRPRRWLHHLADEADAAFLYRELAQAERDPRKVELYSKLAEVEDRHVEMWQQAAGRARAHA